MPSLPKNEIGKFLKRLIIDTRLLIDSNIDSCAIAIKYIDGKFNKAITRKGKDVSRKLKAIKNVPKEIKIRLRIVVRGELFATEEKPNSS